MIMLTLTHHASTNTSSLTFMTIDFLIFNVSVSLKLSFGPCIETRLKMPIFRQTEKNWEINGLYQYMQGWKSLPTKHRKLVGDRPESSNSLLAAGNSHIIMSMRRIILLSTDLLDSRVLE